MGTSVYLVLNVYAMLMAEAFTISTTTIAVRLGILPRWLAVFGWVVAVVLLLTIERFAWVQILFPVWVLGPERPSPGPPARRPRRECNYLRMLTARAITSSPTISEIASSAIIRSLAQGLMADTSDGLKAVAVRRRLLY